MTPEEARAVAASVRDADLVGPDGATWVERLAPERERLVEAAQTLLATGSEDAGLELGAQLWRLWMRIGDIGGGRRFLAILLNHDAKASRARAVALYADGVLAFREGKQSESQWRSEQALTVARQVGDREAEALALVGLSRVAFRDGDYERVIELASRARELVKDLHPQAASMPLHLLAAGTRLQGDHDRAVAHYTESLELFRSLKDAAGIAMELHNLGHVELHRGHVDVAARYFEECARLRTRDSPVDAAMTHLNQAALAYARGERERAQQQLGLVQPALDQVGMRLDPDDAFEVNWLRERLEATDC